jgi:hypothetical protein
MARRCRGISFAIVGLIASCNAFSEGIVATLANDPSAGRKTPIGHYVLGKALIRVDIEMEEVRFLPGPLSFVARAGGVPTLASQNAVFADSCSADSGQDATPVRFSLKSVNVRTEQVADFSAVFAAFGSRQSYVRVHSELGPESPLGSAPITRTSRKPASSTDESALSTSIQAADIAFHAGRGSPTQKLTDQLAELGQLLRIRRDFVINSPRSEQDSGTAEVRLREIRAQEEQIAARISGSIASRSLTYSALIAPPAANQALAIGTFSTCEGYKAGAITVTAGASDIDVCGTSAAASTEVVQRADALVVRIGLDSQARDALCSSLEPRRLRPKGPVGLLYKYPIPYLLTASLGGRLLATTEVRIPQHGPLLVGTSDLARLSAAQVSIFSVEDPSLKRSIPTPLK